MRLPEKVFRVNIIEGYVGMYKTGSKTYSARHHAEAHANVLRGRGIRVEVYESEPIVWNLVESDPPKNMDPLF